MLVTHTGSTTFGEEFGFYYQPDSSLAEHVRRRREEVRTQQQQRSMPIQETKTPPPHGPSMARSVDRVTRR